jgi:hypothetical protein
MTPVRELDMGDREKTLENIRDVLREGIHNNRQTLSLGLKPEHAFGTTFQFSVLETLDQVTGVAITSTGMKKAIMPFLLPENLTSLVGACVEFHPTMQQIALRVFANLISL